jgi:hypothetical protein
MAGDVRCDTLGEYLMDDGRESRRAQAWDAQMTLPALAFCAAVLGKKTARG